jgi:hypothetical protein
MSYFYYRKSERVIVHKATGARLPFVPAELGARLVARLARLVGVKTKAEAEYEIVRALVQVAADAMRDKR